MAPRKKRSTTKKPTVKDENTQLKSQVDQLTKMMEELLKQRGGQVQGGDDNVSPIGEDQYTPAQIKKLREIGGKPNSFKDDKRLLKKDVQKLDPDEISLPPTRATYKKVVMICARCNKKYKVDPALAVGGSASNSYYCDGCNLGGR